jgi:hypothetical protein
VFDNYFSTDPAVQGVTIHLDPEVTTLTQSLLIDTTPGSSGGFTDAPLTPGRTFTDGVVSITVQSVSGTTATVDVATALPPDTQPPSAPAPVAEAAADHVTLRWPASTDNVGVTGYRVYRGADLAATLSGTEWIDTAVTPGTTYSYKVVAYDAAGNAASSGYVSATVPASQTSPPPGNTSPPSGSPPPGSTRPPPDPGAAGNPPGIPVDSRSPVVRITSPARGSRVRTRTVIRAQGSDDVGVLRIELWLDGKLRAVVADGRLAWRWQVAHSRPGRHLIVVRAYDASGNRGASSRRVFVVR